jgi:hypothetical protein
MCVAPFDDLDGVPEVERQHELARRGFAYATDHPSYVAQVLLHNSLRLLSLEGSNWWRYEAEMLSLPALARGRGRVRVLRAARGGPDRSADAGGPAGHRAGSG